MEMGAWGISNENHFFSLICFMRPSIVSAHFPRESHANLHPIFNFVDPIIVFEKIYTFCNDNLWFGSTFSICISPLSHVKKSSNNSTQNMYVLIRNCPFQKQKRKKKSNFELISIINVDVISAITIVRVCVFFSFTFFQSTFQYMAV